MKMPEHVTLAMIALGVGIIGVSIILGHFLANSTPGLSFEAFIRCPVKDMEFRHLGLLVCLFFFLNIKRK